MDFAALAQACRRANAAYIEGDTNSKAAFEALGDTWIGQFQDATRQAVLSVDSSSTAWLSISGTRASQGALGDVLRDVQLGPVTIKGGAVTQGVQDGMDHVFDWALSMAPKGDVFNLTGHSLGSCRAQIAPAYLPAEQIGRIYGFSAPKFISAQFFASYPEVFQRLIACINSGDGWASWPWVDARWTSRAPSLTVDLQNDQGAYQALADGNRWPSGFDFSAHSIDLVQSRLDTIETSQKVPA